jgi:hypothetical protein
LAQPRIAPHTMTHDMEFSNRGMHFHRSCQQRLSAQCLCQVSTISNALDFSRLCNRCNLNILYMQVPDCLYKPAKTKRRMVFTCSGAFCTDMTRMVMVALSPHTLPTYSSNSEHSRPRALDRTAMNASTAQKARCYNGTCQCSPLCTPLHLGVGAGSQMHDAELHQKLFCGTKGSAAAKVEPTASGGRRGCIVVVLVRWWSVAAMVVP